jgi:L-alanine-DL-glutamate epimerase-like enolase superfamily enzyme
MILHYQEHTLHFIKPAKTSRGAYLEKRVWLLRLEEGTTEYQAEVAPLIDLSVDGQINLGALLDPLLEKDVDLLALKELRETFDAYASLRFGIDVLIRKVEAQNSLWVQSAFTQKTAPIKINGLVWMNDIAMMEQEADDKVASGFDCIKFKVGALDFDEECRLLERFRKKHPSISIRLDANGAFHPKEALSQLKDLSRFTIHSIEQPIAKNQVEDMARLCTDGPIDIALDEELIGLPKDQKSWLLNTVKPQFIILKPTLIGGFDRCDEWISLCEKRHIGWWCTSALEGNIGLFDIAQWVSQYPLHRAQGLGTGSLFQENFPQNTYVERGYLYRL